MCCVPPRIAYATSMIETSHRSEQIAMDFVCLCLSSRLCSPHRQFAHTFSTTMLACWVYQFHIVFDLSRVLLVWILNRTEWHRMNH